MSKQKQFCLHYKYLSREQLMEVIKGDRTSNKRRRAARGELTRRANHPEGNSN